MNGMRMEKALKAYLTLLCLVAAIITKPASAQELPYEAQRLLYGEDQKKTAGKDAAQGAAAKGPSMAFTTSLDRTAIWIGDQFHYLIDVDYPTEYEFVLDNLTKE